MPLLTYAELGAGVQKGVGAIKENLLSFIENLTPEDTPLYSNLGAVPVSAGFVEYLEDTLASAAANAWVEGAASTDPTLSTPSRNSAIVQIFRKDYHVSGRAEAVEHAGMASMLSYQGIKKAKELKRDIELALVNGTAVSGTEIVAPNLGGIVQKLTSGSCWTSTSGTTLTESVFNDILQLTYAYNRTPKEVYCNALVKRTLNGYRAGVTANVQASEKLQVSVIDVLDTEFGRVSLHKQRNLAQSASKTTYGNTWFAIDPDAFKLGWLRPITEKTLGIDGDRERRMLIGELTLIVKSKNAGCGGDGFVPYLV
jgi:hypothetical protein